MLTVTLATVSLAIWIYLLFGRGGFWRPARNLVQYVAPGQLPQKIVAVVPARNEADVIARSIRSLLEQQVGPPLVHIVVVDDASDDGTAEIATQAARDLGSLDRLTVLKGRPLEAGWTGKLWALSQGIDEALSHEPEYLLFTDADIVHGPGSIKNLAAVAERGGYDLVSLMAKLSCESLAEKALIPAFVFFFFELYPPAWIRSRSTRTAGAAGGCILIRPKMLERIGGLSALRTAVIDDCTLAKKVKQAGGRIWLGLTQETLSIRRYGTFSEVGRMISRTAFSQLHHSVFLLTATIFGLAITYFAPPALTLAGSSLAVRLPAAAAWLAMTICYLPFVRFYGRSRAWSITLPAIATFYLGATIASATLYWLGRGGRWKGRVQDQVQ